MCTNLLPHEAPRFGRLWLRGFPVTAPLSVHHGGIFLRSLQPGHLTLVGIRTSGPHRRRVCAGIGSAIGSGLGTRGFFGKAGFLTRGFLSRGPNSILGPQHPSRVTPRELAYTH